jgi:TetR/AcrR family transcriptional regulator
MVKIKEIPQSTEEKILEAAKKVFVIHGMEGTSMQQIADEAKINKSLLHYYFRSKEKLFAYVLKYAFKFVIPQFKVILESDEDVYTKIEKLVNRYMDLLMQNKFIPAFILHEINRNPDGIVEVMRGAGVDPQMFIDQFNKEIQKGAIRPIDPNHLIVNILSLCIFPVVARPLAQRLFFNNNEQAYHQFLEERKKTVPDFIIHSIKA